MPQRAYIAVIGGQECTPLEADRAYQVGRLLASVGCVLVCGGRGGVMEAACRGAREAGGETLGILPGFDRAQANPYLDVSVVTGMGSARNAIIALTADGVIAIGGGHGTLSEIGLALKSGRPVVGLDTWEPVRPDDDTSPIVAASGPEEAVGTALKLAGRAGNPR